VPYKVYPNKNARFNFVINAQFIQKVLIFLYQYKVDTLPLIVEHNIRQMSPSTLLSLGDENARTLNLAFMLGHPVLASNLRNSGINTGE